MDIICALYGLRTYHDITSYKFPVNKLIHSFLGVTQAYEKQERHPYAHHREDEKLYCRALSYDKDLNAMVKLTNWLDAETFLTRADYLGKVEQLQHR